MKLTEISRAALKEAVEKINNTRYSTADLVLVAEAHNKNAWSDIMSSDELDVYVQQLAELSSVLKN